MKQLADGDIPCTPETEPTYSYTWNFCTDVTIAPPACNLMKKSGVALQSIYVSETEYDCYVIGRYDETQDDLYYSLLDTSDPSKGVSIKYPSGEPCLYTNVFRSATIDVICSNVLVAVESATESSSCQYHLVMKSYHGCPKVRKHIKSTTGSCLNSECRNVP